MRYKQAGISYIYYIAYTAQQLFTFDYLCCDTHTLSHTLTHAFAWLTTHDSQREQDLGEDDWMRCGAEQRWRLNIKKKIE